MSVLGRAILDLLRGRMRRLKPTARQEGVYRLYRRAFEMDVLMVEPQGASYVLTPFDAEAFMRKTVKAPEDAVNRLIALLFDFRSVSYDTKDGWVKTEPIPPGGWPGDYVPPDLQAPALWWAQREGPFAPGSV